MVLNDLNKEENSFRRLAENLPGIVYRVLIEDDNRMIFFNDMVQTMTGYSPEELKKGKVCSIYPLILPEDRLNVINIVKNAIENNVPFEVEYRINNKSGELKWLFERGRPIRGDNENPSYIDGVIFDITDRKETEKKLKVSNEELDKRIHERTKQLKKSEEQFRLLFESISDPIHVIDADLKIMYINPAFERWLKSFNLDLNIVGKTPVEVWPFIGERVNDEYQKVFKTKQMHIKEDWAQFNDIRTFTETRKIPILKSGNVIQVITIIRDFSDRKKAEQKLKESEKRFKLLFENVPLQYQSLDSNGNILEVNRAWINFFGYSKEEVIGKWFGDFIDSEYLEVFNTRFPKFKETREVRGAEFEIIKKDGSHAIVLLDGNTSSDENGNFKQSHCIFKDITEQKQIQIELQESERLLKNAQELAHIGHWKLNPSTMEVSGSDELFKIFGLTHDKAMLEQIAEGVHPEDREMDLFHIRRGMEKGESWD
ncbi:MAG: PAS domain S-box protein, partial [Candidatus Lokiarchaeota archaeon]|nr:PAS domain S-box protein [Candidatus Lokiarchaeota archaeon]